MNNERSTDWEFQKRVLLSVQRALVGEVTPTMRAVAVETSAAEVRILVYTHGDLSKSEREAFDAGVVTDVVADFPHPENGDPVISIEFDRRDRPGRIPRRGLLVFALSDTQFDR